MLGIEVMNTMRMQHAGRLAAAAAAGLLAFTCAAAAGTNLSFEAPATAAERAPGWQLRARGATVAVDGRTVRDGAQSLRITPDGSDADVRVTQRVATAGLDGNRVRISAAVRTAASTPGTDDSTDSKPGTDSTESRPGTAALWVRVDGGEGLLYVDYGAERRADGGRWERLSIEAPLAANAERLTFGAGVEGPGRVWLDDIRIEAYDTAELPAASAGAVRYVERALAIMRTHALVRDEVDWGRLREATLAQARGAEKPADTYLALQFALTSLGDGHSHFMPADRMRQLERAPVSNARTGRPRIAAESRPLGERIGYVRVPGFAGGAHADQVAYAEDLHARFEKLDARARCGWVVDLRGNSGGNLWPMLAGLGPLVGDGVVGAAVRPGAAREPIAYRDGRVALDGHVQLRLRREPYRVARPEAPVAVLVDGRTASAAEIVAMFLDARAATRTFGTPTRGVPTATRTFPLSDGAALILTVATTSDGRGRVADGPIEPDVRVDDAGPSAPAAADAALGSAVAWLGC